MSVWAGYLAGMDINLQAGERAIIWQLLNSYGLENDGPQPDRRFTFRDNLDGDKRICKAAFDKDALAISVFRPALADALGLTPAEIVVNAIQQTLDTLPTNIVTFRYSPDTTNRFRLALFGGTAASRMQSGIEARAYLSANQEEWETGLD